jgi:hypothetical protein
MSKCSGVQVERAWTLWRRTLACRSACRCCLSTSASPSTWRRPEPGQSTWGGEGEGGWRQGLVYISVTFSNFILPWINNTRKQVTKCNHPRHLSHRKSAPTKPMTELMAVLSQFPAVFSSPYWDTFQNTSNLKAFDEFLYSSKFPKLTHERNYGTNAQPF